MRKILVISLMLSALAFGQNDGLVKTYYPNGAIETEGNYTKGFRDGLWTFWYEGEVFKITALTVSQTLMTQAKEMVCGIQIQRKEHLN